MNFLKKTNIKKILNKDENTDLKKPAEGGRPLSRVASARTRTKSIHNINNDLNEFKSSYSELKDSLSNPTIITQHQSNNKNVSENNILQNKETNQIIKIENHGNQNHGIQNNGNHIVGAIPGGKFVVNERSKRKSFEKVPSMLNHNGKIITNSNSPFQRAGHSLVSQH
jgi:hypothetical protein